MCVRARVYVSVTQELLQQQAEELEEAKAVAARLEAQVRMCVGVFVCRLWTAYVDSN